MVLKTCALSISSLTLAAAVAWGDAPAPIPPLPPPTPVDSNPLPAAPPPGIVDTPRGSVPPSVDPYRQNLPLIPSPDPQMTGSVVSPGWSGAAAATGTWGAGPAAGYGPHWAPGGYESRIGSPYLYHDPNGGQHVVTGNPYYDHFGPGFHRESLHGHYRFPYYNYRAPWYYPGRAVYNRDTNFPW